MYFTPHTSSWGLLRIAAILLLALALMAYTYDSAAPAHLTGVPQGNVSENALGNAARMGGQ
jgi:hypothetical protein